MAVAVALAVVLTLFEAVPVASDTRPPTDAAICAEYERLAAFYGERINGVEKFCHKGVPNAAD
jgi:hypothetical protein